MARKKESTSQAAAAKTPAAPVSKPAKAAPAARKKPSPARKPASGKKSPAYTYEDIQLRAYFVAEKRHREGRSGDAHSDWIEAERQLKRESRAKSLARSGTKKKA